MSNSSGPPPMDFGPPSSWTPAGETPQTLKLERELLAGFFLQLMGFGAYLVIAMACLYYTTLKPPLAKAAWGMTAYIAALTLGTTLFTALNWKYAELMFIDYRGFPGGPAAFFIEDFSFWANTVANAAYIFNNFLVDGLILWRCCVFWNFNWLVITLPICWFITTTVLSVFTTLESAVPGASIFTHSVVLIAIPYWSLSVAFNIVLTLLIVGRLFHMRRSLARTLGRQHTRTYTSIASMLVESAALYSTVGIVFIAGFARNADFADAILPFLGEVMAISPLLIILQVASGRSITDTFTSSTMSFQQSSGGAAGSMGSRSAATRVVGSKSSGTTLALNDLRGSRDDGPDSPKIEHV